MQINLIGKKRRGQGSKNWFSILMIVAFAVLGLYFLVNTAYVMIRLTQIKRELQKVDREIESASVAISANKEALAEYVLSKHILDKMSTLKQENFRYKDYLDQVAKLMPANAVLTNIDFTIKGWVAASVTLPNTDSLKEMERNLSDVTSLSPGEFASIFSESVAEDASGQYNAKLHFEIKTNDRN
ncbi:MAG: hypothetical protein UX08_C0010G0030 [Candidatus Collierbacteria bacterium GW2011_GWB1_45_35]|uniref:Fimbrial assembly family protein n=1 Tax=Candidatus Collierbacteria bacterium GW2011_GWB2_45_17 TaxID=1618388 RepID=A0A837IE62_9BACT|nr:MAG: hypothetical protein UW48_C0007G0029 [Microgenomates group bacterium GW2011_GWC1_44_23]KKT95410.1 MAG: hypothetical protein UW96_C0007G0039 [Candidatus Collierbacteria bacterium GW2011_GWA1_45_15]KKU00060.1 MAG: hypothetical protein UX01_C0007G0039 [Candidatus Collierbacteria bacterium GW2011_GWB2_45_17]KKU05159.1 MAG: hypothetical protein UX08_C0010G0030 [Candidatus Collierbacteria bacterium GW2011_GWB1_45_35]KKU08412.1 MAG: hypothetical protein UX11_C0004G0016 [Candidatus Collierbacte